MDFIKDSFCWFLETLLRAWKDKSLTGLRKSHIWQRTSIQKIYIKSKVQFNSILRGKIYKKTLNQDKQLASNHMKKCHYPPGICIFKPQGYYYIPIRTSKNFKTDLPIIDWGVEQLHAYLQCPQEFRMVSSFWKTVWRVLQKLNAHQLYSSAITLWVFTQEKEMHTSSQRLVHACSQQPQRKQPVSVNGEWMQRPPSRDQAHCCWHAAAGLRAATLRSGSQEKSVHTGPHSQETREKTESSL